MTPQRARFLTGATGFLGGELLARLVLEDRPIIALVRARDAGHAARRGDAALHRSLGRAPTRAERARVHWLPGDLSQDRMGQSVEGWVDLAEAVGEIFHCAGSPHGDVTLAQADAVHLAGAKRVHELAFAASAFGPFRRLHLLSTAFVAGKATGLVTADHLPTDDPANFRNPFEQSKARAERFLREHGAVPYTIYRPSIIVGDRHSGWARNWGVSYAPMWGIATGRLRAFPQSGRALTDFVPVDYVVDGLLVLASREDTEGETHHLTAGDQVRTVSDFVEVVDEGVARRIAGRRSQRTQLLAQRPWTALHWGLGLRDTRARRALRRLQPALAYTGVDAHFEERDTRERLEQHGVQMPEFEDYFPRVVDYALRQDFGRVPEPARVSLRPRGFRVVG